MNACESSTNEQDISNKTLHSVAVCITDIDPLAFTADHFFLGYSSLCLTVTAIFCKTGLSFLRAFETFGRK